MSFEAPQSPQQASPPQKAPLRAWAAALARFVKRQAAAVFVYGLLLFPLWIPWRSVVWIIFLLAMFTHVLADLVSGLARGRPSRAALLCGWAATAMRWLISAIAVAGFGFFILMLNEISVVLTVGAVVLAAASIYRPWRRLYPPTHFLLMAFTALLWSYEGPLYKAMLHEHSPAWLEPVFVRGFADVDCGPDAPPYMPGIFQNSYSIRNLAFEPDESAVYVTIKPFQRDSYHGITLFKVGLKPGVEGLCWTDFWVHNLALDPANRRLFAMQVQEKKLRALDRDTFKEIDVERLNYPAVDVVPLPDENRIWVFHESEHVTLLDYKTLGPIGKFEQFWGSHARYIFDPATNEVFVANLGMGLKIAQGRKLDDDDVIGRTGVRGVGSWGIDLSADGTTFYITDFALGRVCRADRQTMETVWCKRLKPGLRPVREDATRDLIYVGNFMTGELDVLRLSDPSRRAIIRIGSGLERIDLGPVSNDVYLGTKTGLFKIKIDELVAGLFDGAAR